MTKGTRQAQTDELVKLYKENNIYNFYVKDLDGNWQAQNFDAGAAESVPVPENSVLSGDVQRDVVSSVGATFSSQPGGFSRSPRGSVR